MAVSATRWAWSPTTFSRLACARARVSAALRADRLRFASFSLRVAAALWAAADFSVSVRVAMGITFPSRLGFFDLVLPVDFCPVLGPVLPVARGRKQNGPPEGGWPGLRRWSARPR